MSKASCPREFERKAARLAHRMLKGVGYLERAGDRLPPQGEWHLLVAKNRYCRPVETVAGQLVSEMNRHGWLEMKPGGTLAISRGASLLLQRHGVSTTITSPSTRPGISQRMLEQEGRATLVQVNETENPLAWLARRKNAKGEPYISENQVAAGEILRRDYTMARTEPSITMKWDGLDRPGDKNRAVAGGKHPEPNERILAARQRLRRALDAIGPELSSVALEVCCLSRGIEAAERKLGHSRRTGKVILLAALDKLVEHYRLSPPGIS